MLLLTCLLASSISATAVGTLIVYMNDFSRDVPRLNPGECSIVNNKILIGNAAVADYDKVMAALASNPHCIFVESNKNRISYECRWNGKVLSGNYKSYKLCGRIK